MNATTISTSITAPARPPNAWVAATTYAGRTVKQFIRTPQLIVVTSLTSIMFLLIFRYVFGGAIQTGSIDYVDFLIPTTAVAALVYWVISLLTRRGRSEETPTQDAPRQEMTSVMPENNIQ